MAEFTHPTSFEEYNRNFEQIKPLMNDTEAYYESGRCLFCYDAPCVKACPTGIDIPLFIKQINTGNLNGSAKTIYSANYFGHTCGKVCPTEVLCEGACVFNEQNVKPIDIGRLQSFATTNAIKKDLKLVNKEMPKGKKVAIVGAGPAGISCACELSALGYEVDIFEAKSMPSGLIVHGVAPYKITNEEAIDEIKYLQKQFGFSIEYDSAIETKEALLNLEQQYDAIFLGIGLGKTASMLIAGEDLNNSSGATEFIQEIKLNPLETFVGKKVIVIGGGNTAMDAASECARLGAAEVILAYRRSKVEMRAYEFEYDLAKSVGVKGIFNISPVAILGSEKVEGVRFVKTTTRDGQVIPVADSEFDINCDMVIRATGQSKMIELLEQIKGMELDRKGRIVVNPDTLQTHHPKYFAGGDAVNGGAEVVNAAAEGKKAALGIHNWINGEETIGG
jgi:dihydropyrimidine dehydrogenase (NAD+) subunit PreT